jgi:hypothetical protein
VAGVGSRTRGVVGSPRMITALLPLLLACAPQTFPEDSLLPWQERIVESSYPARFEAVWSSTLATTADFYPVDVPDKTNGRITTEWVVGASDYIFSVFSGTRIPEKIRYRMHIDVTERQGRTVVRVRNQEQVEKDIISANLVFTGAIYEWIDVPSSTKKEQELLEAIADNLARGKGEPAPDLDYRE